MKSNYTLIDCEVTFVVENLIYDIRCDPGLHFCVDGLNPQQLFQLERRKLVYTGTVQVLDRFQQHATQSQ
jgi:hypothetical protein